MKDKKFLLIGTIIFIIMLLVTNVYAAEAGTFKATATANSTKLKPEEEVTITVEVSDIKMGEDGINALEGYIEYDKNIFEEIKSSSIQSLNNWTTTYNDENGERNGKFLSANISSGVKEKTQIFTIKFKVKKDIKETTSTKINFRDLTSNDGANLVNAGTKTVELTVEVPKEEEQKPSTDNGNKVDKPTTNNNNNNTNNPTNTQTNKVTNTTVKDNSKSATKLPKTGKSEVLILLLVVGVVSLIIVGIKNKNMRGIK